MSSYNLILIRHGQSLWNQENRFTGWMDIDLSEQGKKEAKESAHLLKKNQLNFDLACTSFLKRAIRTMWIILEEMDQMWVPALKSWRLNERHYGKLTGLNKKETAKIYGETQVQLWRRSYNTPPPPLTQTPNQTQDRRYADTKPPNGESLKQTMQRVLPFWEQAIAPNLQAGKTVLTVAHGNSLRALVKHIESLNDQEILKVEIPTGAPIAYTLSKDTLKLINKKNL